MSDHQDFSSSFVNKYAILILFFLAVTASYFQASAVCGFLLFLDMICLFAYIWGKYCFNKIEISIEAENKRMFPETWFSVQYVLENKKMLPLIWLDLLQEVSENACIVPDESFQKVTITEMQETKQFFERKFTWILWHQKIEWKTKYYAKKRGIYFIEKVKLSSGDGFGLSLEEKGFILQQPSMFVVYPKRVPVNTQFFIQNSSYMELAPDGYEEDISLIKSIRKYEGRDSMKKINWRLAARGGDLQMNQYEKRKPRAVFFILDLESYFQAQEELEKMLCVIGSLFLELSEHNLQCGLALPQMDGQKECFILPSEAVSVEELLFNLSAIPVLKGKCIFDNRKLILSREFLGHIYLVSKSIESFCCASLLSGFPKHTCTLIWNEMDQKQVSYEHKAISLLQILKEDIK